MRTCTLGHHLVGLQGNVVDPQGNFGDDLGVDNLRMECDDGDILDGLYGVPNAQVSEPLVWGGGAGQSTIASSAHSWRNENGWRPAVFLLIFRLVHSSVQYDILDGFCYIMVACAVL